MCDIKEIRWSPYSRESCSISLDGNTRIGFGVHPIFDIAPGAWNIFWLTFAQLDQIAYYKGDPDKYVITCDALAVCAGAALQIIKFEEGKTITIGDLALITKPKEFIELIAKVPTFLPLVFYGKSWLNVARRRAARYRVMPSNVVNIDFRKGG